MPRWRQIEERLATKPAPGVSVDATAKNALVERFHLVDTNTLAIRLDGTLATLIALHAAARSGRAARSPGRQVA